MSSRRTVLLHSGDEIMTRLPTPLEAEALRLGEGVPVFEVHSPDRDAPEIYSAASTRLYYPGDQEVHASTE